MNEKESNFKELEDFFKNSFSSKNLNFQMCRSLKTGETYLRICNNEQSNELNYLPTFYLIGLHKNDSTFILKFVTHQSKVLEEYHVNVAQKIDSIPKKLKDFCDASLSLCYGIDVHQKFVDCVFVEVFNDVISVRSRKCLFVTSSPNLPCSECLKLKLLTGLTHVKGESFSSLGDVEVNVCDVVESGETIVTEIVLFQPEVESIKAEPANTSAASTSSDVRQELNPADQYSGRSRRESSTNCFSDFRTKNSTICSTNELAEGSKRRRKKRKSEIVLSHSESANFTQQCPICLHTYNAKIKFDLDQKNHEKNLPELDSPVACPVCGLLIDRRRLLNAHFNDVHNEDKTMAICCVCFAKMPQKRLKYHFRERHKPKDNGLLCPVCGKTIKWTQHDLRIHLACAHGLDDDCTTPSMKHACNVCGKTYGHADRLKQHVFRAHHSASSFPCNECNKVFCALSKVIEHKVCKHLKIRPFKCRLCDYAASQMNNVYKHCQNRHGFRGKRADVEVDEDLMVKIRNDLDYNYCGQSVEKIFFK